MFSNHQGIEIHCIKLNLLKPSIISLGEIVIYRIIVLNYMDILNKLKSLKSIKIRPIQVINSKSPLTRREGLSQVANLMRLTLAKLTLLTKVLEDPFHHTYSLVRRNVRNSKKNIQTGIHTKS
jgi:hypothetical protein